MLLKEGPALLAEGVCERVRWSSWPGLCGSPPRAPGPGLLSCGALGVSPLRSLHAEAREGERRFSGGGSRCRLPLEGLLDADCWALPPVSDPQAPGEA